MYVTYTSSFGEPGTLGAEQELEVQCLSTKSAEPRRAGTSWQRSQHSISLVDISCRDSGQLMKSHTTVPCLLSVGEE